MIVNAINLMKLIYSTLLLIFFQSLNAQYYYKDIIATNETNRQFQNLIANNVLTVTATGYDPNGIKDPEFSEVLQVIREMNALKTTTNNNLSAPGMLLQVFDNNNRLIRVSDSAADMVSTTAYQYDNAGRIIEIQNTSTDSSKTINENEVHKWVYDESGKLLKMLRIINNIDTLEIRFTLDVKGNVIDESSYKNGNAGEMTYYYYDENNRLSDVVRYRKKLNKLLPDYLFEYNEKNQVIQKITTLSNLNLGYLIWRYAFNEKGLKTKEALFNKNKSMTGKIEYSYTFSY